MSRGMTLIELLAALVISGFVVAMAGRIFLSGNKQFLLRSGESERLGEMYRLKATVRGELTKPITRCEGDRLWLRMAVAEVELGPELKKREPDVQISAFHCLELSPDATALQEWKGGAQPPLVEYRIGFTTRGVRDSLSGSILR